MDSASRLGPEIMEQVFQARHGPAEKIGIEVELGVVDPETGRARPYEGPRGARALLEAVREHGGGVLVMDGTFLTGLRRVDGTKITLEHSGAIEYSSPPMANLTDLVTSLRSELTAISRVAEGMDIALLPNGNLPFDTLEEVTWIPKSRSWIMRRYFTEYGGATSHTPPVTTRTLSTQVTLDYLSEEDWRSKFRMQVLVAPVAAALFVNSPLEEGEISGALSRRLEYWFELPQHRCGVPDIALSGELSFRRFIEWASSISMVYRLRQEEYVAAPPLPFSALLREGFGDGTFPTDEDWKSLLSQIWTDVRVRETLELRAMDGPTLSEIPAVPAFWTGLTYWGPSREAALRLLAGRTTQDYQRAMREAATSGLRARYGPDRIIDLAAELVRLARDGIEARVAAGLDKPGSARFIEPLEEIVKTGRTLAEQQIIRWNDEFHTRPDLFVAAMRVPGS
ncbi:glutamate-cysteine ligase family protein [Streptomyces sp. NPDC052301]|uniref:glutamate-cysteine ligase family protein n=1 Tax=Streptomyces sp. NPDC052301 TaxID=3365687 RepID=UPI0037CE45C5